MYFQMTFQWSQYKLSQDDFFLKELLVLGYGHFAGNQVSFTDAVVIRKLGDLSIC